MITNLGDTHSIINVWIREMRDVAIHSERMRFRKNLERLGSVAAYEISKKLSYVPVTVQTPIGQAACYTLEKQPVVVTILRAGLPLYQGILDFFDNADGAFIGAYRKHHADDSFEILQLYITNPPLDGRPLIIADPMLATGASMSLAISSLLEHGKPSAIHVVSAIATHTAIEHIKKQFPDAYVWVGAIDDELTTKGYISPGLGDAGDLAFGEKKQY
jgi:uracil phosphoribosyltransferase